MTYNPNDLSPYPGSSGDQIWSDATKFWTKSVKTEKDTNSIVTSLMSDSNTRALAAKHGLNISFVTWEDTGRTKGSCFGPNISDMTLCVEGQNMPIIRKPNFEDLTSDQDLDKFSVNVGNETGGPLVSIPLREYLTNITKYTDIKVTGSLIAARDTQVLTSAQACILPLHNGSVEFGVKLYNYQSQATPAVLVVIASAQGTSAHFVLGINNTLDFNKNGLVAKFVAESLKDDRARRGVALDGAMTEEEKLRNALLIFQIPLKYTAPVRSLAYCAAAAATTNMSYPKQSIMSYSVESIDSLKDKYATFGQGFIGGIKKGHGMDHAVLSTSEGRGVYPKLSAHTVERDDRMPIRCTIQYYHVTDNSNISEEEMETIASEVSRHKPVGSLVVGGTTERTTEHTVPTLMNHVRGLFSGL